MKFRNQYNANDIIYKIITLIISECVNSDNCKIHNEIQINKLKKQTIKKRN